MASWMMVIGLCRGYIVIYSCTAPVVTFTPSPSPVLTETRAGSNNINSVVRTGFPFVGRGYVTFEVGGVKQHGLSKYHQGTQSKRFYAMIGIINVDVTTI